jgi:hypothetical protein
MYAEHERESTSQTYMVIIIYLNCKWVFTRWHCTTIRHNTQITHHIHTNTAHKTTKTIKDTLYTMNAMQIQLHLISCDNLWEWSPGQDLNPRHPQHEAGVLSVQSQCSVAGCISGNAESHRTQFYIPPDLLWIRIPME